MTHRVLVTGSRAWATPRAVHWALNRELADARRAGQAMTVAHGACPTGADAHAEEWARANGVTVHAHPPDWGRYGKAAGPLRNAEMVTAGADVCLAFIRGGSPGATHTAALAEAAGIPTRRYTT